MTVVGAKVTELFGVDISGIDPETSAALTKAVLAQDPDVVHEVVDTGRRVIITWPAASFGVVPATLLRVTDAETSEDFLDGTSIDLRITHGRPSGWEGGALTLEMTRLLGEDGEPLGTRRPRIVGDEIPVGWFRYTVAEMKVAGR